MLQTWVGFPIGSCKLNLRSAWKTPSKSRGANKFRLDNNFRNPTLANQSNNLTYEQKLLMLYWGNIWAHSELRDAHTQFVTINTRCNTRPADLSIGAIAPRTIYEDSSVWSSALDQMYYLGTNTHSGEPRNRSEKWKQRVTFDYRSEVALVWRWKADDQRLMMIKIILFTWSNLFLEIVLTFFQNPCCGLYTKYNRKT